MPETCSHEGAMQTPAGLYWCPECDAKLDLNFEVVSEADFEAAQTQSDLDAILPAQVAPPAAPVKRRPGRPRKEPVPSSPLPSGVLSERIPSVAEPTPSSVPVPPMPSDTEQTEQPGAPAPQAQQPRQVARPSLDGVGKASNAPPCVWEGINCPNFKSTTKPCAGKLQTYWVTGDTEKGFIYAMTCPLDHVTVSIDYINATAK